MTNLDERYGRKPANKKPVIALAAVLFLGFMVWAIWANFAPRENVRATVSFTNSVSDQEISAHIRVAQENTVCTFKAMSEGYAIVGYKTVNSANSEYDLTVRTTGKAIDIVVDVCLVK